MPGSGRAPWFTGKGGVDYIHPPFFQGAWNCLGIYHYLVQQTLSIVLWQIYKGSASVEPTAIGLSCGRHQNFLLLVSWHLIFLYFPLLGAQRFGAEEDWVRGSSGQRQAALDRAGRRYSFHGDHSLPAEGGKHHHRQLGVRGLPGHPAQGPQVTFHHTEFWRFPFISILKVLSNQPRLETTQSIPFILEKQVISQSWIWFFYAYQASLG